MTDTQVSLITYLYNVLTQDSTMQTRMGGSVALHHVWAPPDATFPYLVHRADLRQREGNFPLMKAVYNLDIWSYSSQASEITLIRERIFQLIDQLFFHTTEVSNAKVMIQAEGFVPETEPDTWHYNMQFDIDYYRKSETISIIGR